MKYKTFKLFLRLIVILSISIYSIIVHAEKLVFTITPTLRAPTQVVANTNAITYYNVQNTAPQRLTNNGVVDLPSGVTQIATGPESNICQTRFDLDVNQSCLLKLNIKSSQVGQIINAGPIVCHTPEERVACYQPSPSDRINTTIVAQASSSATLSADPVNLSISPNITSYLTVTNTSTNSTYANNVQIYFDDPNVVSQFSSIVADNDCLNLAPGNTCIISLTAKSDADNRVFPAKAAVQASNTQPTAITLNYLSVLTADPMFFGDPSILQPLALTNHSPTPVTINNIVIPSDSFNQSAITITPSTPYPITCPANSVCPAISVAASIDAYGKGDLDVQYTYLSGNYHIPVPIEIEKDIIIPQYSPIKLAPNVSSPPQTSYVMNAGKFNWQYPKIDQSNIITNMTPDYSDCTSRSYVSPSAICSLKFATNNAPIGASANLTFSSSTSGAEVTGSTKVTIDGGIVISPDTDPSNIHLLYRAVKIINQSPNSATINNFEFSPALSKNELKICLATSGSDCLYKSTCSVGGTLSPGSSCLIWVKALDGSASIGNIPEMLKVTVTQGSTTIKNFNINYGRYLFAGGKFTQSGSTPITRIAKWNGINWSALGGTPPSTIYALAEYGGDLITGGSNVSKWNGSAWATLANNFSTDKYVYRLFQYGGNLIAGGNFPNIGGLSIPNIAKWNGTSWSAIGSGLSGGAYAMCLDSNGNLVAGGGSSSTPILSKWNGSSWISLLQASATSLISGPVKSLVLNQNNNLVVGASQFSVYYPNPPYLQRTHNIAFLDHVANIWNYMTNILDDQASTYTPIAMTLDNSNNLLVGFSVRNSPTSDRTNSIAKWKGDISWSSVSGGLGQADQAQVYSLIKNNNPNVVFMGGKPTLAAGSTSINHIAQWDGDVWAPLANGFNNDVYTLVVLPTIDSITE